ncbi:hypothetical protein MN608_09503 [Microdochium nivale]|nr:hypothetical protein MN608_09503 [Microdochium nivale]
MPQRDIMDDPPAYDTLFDTSAQLPNYASIAASSRDQRPSYNHCNTVGSDTPSLPGPSRRCSDSSTAGSDTSSRSTTPSPITTTTTTITSNGGFLNKWRADLAEDRARRARRVVHVSASEADRITGLDRRRTPAAREQQQRGVRWRVYYETCPVEGPQRTTAKTSASEGNGMLGAGAQWRR